MRRKANPYREALREATKKRPNTNRVRQLLEEALEAGDPEAAYALGTWYLHGHNVKQSIAKAFSLLRQAARRNVPDALFDLGICYEKGEGTKVEPRRAFECYLGAALRGEKLSFYEVGRCLYHGIGVTKSTRLAWLWLDRARELGVSDVPVGVPKAPPRHQTQSAATEPQALPRIGA